MRNPHENDVFTQPNHYPVTSSPPPVEPGRPRSRLRAGAILALTLMLAIVFGTGLFAGWDFGTIPALSINEWLKLLGEFYEQYGYLVVFLGALGENTALLGLLLPGNSLALLGAAYARLGTLHLGWVILLASLGTILGYHIDYLLGRFVLARVASGWSTSRLGRRIRLAGRLRLARRLIAKHGGKAILMSHLIGQLSSFVALSAGMTRMKYRRFLGYELVAAALWNTAFCLLGYLLSSKVSCLSHRISLQIRGILAFCEQVNSPLVSL